MFAHAVRIGVENGDADGAVARGVVEVNLAIPRRDARHPPANLDRALAAMGEAPAAGQRDGVRRLIGEDQGLQRGHPLGHRCRPPLAIEVAGGGEIVVVDTAPAVRQVADPGA